jgi:hypothetical protein
MRVFLTIACLAAITSAFPVLRTDTTQKFDATLYDVAFDQFIAKFGKQYTAEEKAERLRIFADNLDFVNSWNANNKSVTGVTVAMNEFGDLSHAEFKSFYLGYRPSAAKQARFAAEEAAKTHYGNPTAGCLTDEQPVRIQGLSGDFCSPDCTSTPCPTDVPTGVTAHPQCALKAASGNDKKCALVCSPSTEWASLRAGDAQCGTATCQPIQGVGICTYGAGPTPGPPTPPAPPTPPTPGPPAKTCAPCSDYGRGAKPGASDYCQVPVIHYCYPYTGSCAAWEPHCSTGAGPTPTPPPGPTPPSPPEGPGVDWVSKGAVTPVKNQAHCGSCWAFSTTGGLEGAIFVKHGVLESLSEEELVQCDKVDHGCKGGAMDNGFAFIKKTKGIATESQYPYTTATGAGTSGSCVSSKETPVAKYTDTVTGSTDVTPNSESALKAAVALHPVSVAIEADKQVFQFYKTGVLKASAGCGTKLDHGVLAVGYGSETGTMYWKVKNSWGPTWGDEGYIKIERTESASSPGTCGIAMDASYPNLS